MLGQYVPLVVHSKGRTGPGNTCGEVHQLSKFTSTFMLDTSTALEPAGRTGHQELLDSTPLQCLKAGPAAPNDAKQILTTCTNTSIPASEAAPTPIQGLQTSTESRRHQIPPDTPSHSPYKVHDP